MAPILSGIGKVIGSIFGVEPKEEDLPLEERINKALAEEREKIRPSREDMDTFLWFTGDNNPAHRLRKRAKELGFGDTPLAGAHVAAYGEQFIQRVVQDMREFWGADMKIVAQKNKFHEPVFPGDKILWQVIGYRVKENELELDVTGSIKGKEIIMVRPRLGRNYRMMPQLAGQIYSRRYLLHAEHLEEAYNSVGGKNDGQVSHMLASAFVPATLVRFLEDKTQTLEGTNLAMDFEFINEAKPGRLQVDIFPPREPRPQYRKVPKLDEAGNPIINEIGKQPLMETAKDGAGNPIIERYLYVFRAVTSQETRPVTFGEIKSAVPLNINFDD